MARSHNPSCGRTLDAADTKYTPKNKFPYKSENNQNYHDYI